MNLRLPLALAILLAAQPSSAAPGKDLFHRLQGRLVAAHRGGYFGQPNTLAQFRKALSDRAADIIETDLRLTDDGVVVVFHDDTLEQHTNCKGSVEGTRFDDLRHCSYRNGGHIPSFLDVLNLVAGRMLVDAELKTDTVAAPAVRLALAKSAMDWIYFQTQNSSTRYAIVRNVSPRIAIIVKADDAASFARIAALHDLYVVAVDVERDQLTPALVARVHAMHKLVSVDSWRFQFTEERFVAACDRVFRLGADIAVSNNPASCMAQKSTALMAPLGWIWWLDRPHVRHFWSGHPWLGPELEVVAFLSLLSLVLMMVLSKLALGRASLMAFPTGKHRHANRARFVARGLLLWRVNNEWLHLLSQPEMRPLTLHNRNAFTKVQRSFVCASFTPAERLAALKKHYCEFTKLPRNVRDGIHSLDGFLLFSMEQGGYCHDFRFMSLQEFAREGEITLRWSANAKLVCSLTFMMSPAAHQSAAILIGGIQGCRDESGQELFRSLTKSMHGLRPMSTMIHVMRAFARGLGIGRLAAVGDDAHALTRKRSLGRLHSSYDEIWLSNGGTRDADGWFNLPAETPIRDLSEVSTHKRAAYRRRVALMAQIDEYILESIQRCFDRQG